MGRSADRATLQRAHYQGASAIVTGGASGIGRALVNELVNRGATVLVADVDGEGARTVAASAPAPPDGQGAARAVALDVTDAGAVEAVVADFADRQDGLDFIFNNAGVGVGGEVADLSLAHWRRTIDVNLYGVVHGVAAAYPPMVRRGRGHIVNTASLAGLIPGALMVPYSATKHAVVGLSLGLRSEAASHGVRVSVVCPGVIDTPLLDRGNPADLPPVPSEPDARSLLTQLLGRAYPAARLAADVLDAVALDRALIVAPGHARAAWALYRAWPGLLLSQSRRRMRPPVTTPGGPPPRRPPGHH
jgi:NAD(P)-dependent dehydrogenase (short-subunit alcohol dehydrogenase family)